MQIKVENKEEFRKLLNNIKEGEVLNIDITKEGELKKDDRK